MKTTGTPFSVSTDRVSRALTAAALALASACAAAYFVGTAASLSFRYPLEYGETVMVLPLLRMSEVPWIYGDITKMPHHLMPYHPFYIYLTHLVTPLWEGVSQGSVYTAGRAVTGIAAAVCAVWICLFCRRRAGAGRAVSALAGLLFLSSPFLLGEATHVKPDLTALALALTGLYLGTADAARRGALAGAAVCFALAFLTKQNYLFAAAAAALWRVSRGEWRTALALGGGSAALALAGVGVIAWGSEGRYWEHAFLNVNAFYSWKIFWINWGKIGPQIGAVLALGAAAAVFLTARRRKTAAGAAGIYFFISASILLLLGKGGWGENHAMEPLAAACLALGSMTVPAWRPAAAVIIIAQLVFYLPRHHWDPAAVRAPLAETERRMDELIPLLKSVKGPILAENAGILIAAGLPVWYQVYEFAQMSYSGQFDQTVILDELRQKRYALIVVQTNFFQVKGTGRFTPEFIRTLGEHYRFAGAKHGQFFYAPKAAA
jgi:hypothetical protein